jgi:orotate phosphoribosyltransferase
MKVPTSEEILQLFEEARALLRGHFILRSGLHSGHFFQCARLFEDMSRVTQASAWLLQKLQGVSFTTVVAPAMGGLVLGQEVARQANARYLFVEKEEGKLVLRRNFQIHPGEKILIVEDVITRGGRVQETIDIVRAHGGDPVAVAVLVDRSEGKVHFDVPHYALIEMSFPTYEADKIPAELASIPASKPGS